MLNSKRKKKKLSFHSKKNFFKTNSSLKHLAFSKTPSVFSVSYFFHLHFESLERPILTTLIFNGAYRCRQSTVEKMLKCTSGFSEQIAPFKATKKGIGE